MKYETDKIRHTMCVVTLSIINKYAIMFEITSITLIVNKTLSLGQ
jgi:hypothetical protein